ncbi:MAG TPA: hypothetical protein PLQ56_01130 [Aggregatilineales bacterium]|nr:hypothetical protein [Aggregatilineales bacterium]
MPYHMDWYIEKQILMVHLHGDFTVTDYVQYFQDCYTAYNQSEGRKIHIIADSSFVTHNPNLLELRRHVPKGTHTNEGWVLNVISGPSSRLFRFVLNTISNASQKQIRHMNSIPQAIEFLRDMDSSLNWELARPEVLEMPMPVKA